MTCGIMWNDELHLAQACRMYRMYFFIGCHWFLPTLSFGYGFNENWVPTGNTDLVRVQLIESLKS